MHHEGADIKVKLTVRIIHHRSEDGVHHIADEGGQTRDLRYHVSREMLN